MPLRSTIFVCGGDGIELEWLLLTFRVDVVESISVNKKFELRFGLAIGMGGKWKEKKKLTKKSQIATVVGQSMNNGQCAALTFSEIEEIFIEIRNFRQRWFQMLFEIFHCHCGQVKQFLDYDVWTPQFRCGTDIVQYVIDFIQDLNQATRTHCHSLCSFVYYNATVTYAARKETNVISVNVLAERHLKQR